MPRLFSPLHRRHLLNGYILVVNQLFGGNKNTSLGGNVKYGENGHTGIDIKTTRAHNYEGKNLKWKNDHWEGKYEREARDQIEANGRIPILASMPGRIEYRLNPDKETQGWGVYITADPETEEGQTVQYRLLYWHIEAPSHDLNVYKPKEESFLRNLAFIIMNKRPRVTVGEEVATAGNNGMSTGPHLHFQLEKRTKGGLIWSGWTPIDPIPFFADSSFVIQEQEQSGLGLKFHMGKLISEEQFKSLTLNWAKYE